MNTRACTLTLLAALCVSVGSWPVVAQQPEKLRSPVPVTAVRLAPGYDLPVLFARLADDDGGKASTLTQANARAAVDQANAIYARNGGNVRFHVDPASDFSGHIKSRLMNHDCTLTAGQTEASIAANTHRDANGDGVIDGNKVSGGDWDVLCDRRPARGARTAYALMRPDKIVVYSRGSREYIVWNTDDTPNHWQLKFATGGSSSALGYYINMPGSFGNDALLAHEVGHYLHNAHTFGGAKPKAVADAAKFIADYLVKHPSSDGLKVFDGDSVQDTPPDPGTAIFTTVHGDHCLPDKGAVTVPVKTAAATKNFTLAPDRANVMSYFKGCPFDFHMSRGQYARIHAALKSGNRATLGNAQFLACFGGHREPFNPHAGTANWERQTAALLRRIAACHVAARVAMPPLFVEVYAPPHDPRPWVRQARQIGALRVHEAREAAAIRQILADEIVD